MIVGWPSVSTANDCKKYYYDWHNDEANEGFFAIQWAVEMQQGSPESKREWMNSKLCTMILQKKSL